jgi:hypothetical protein
VQRYLTLRLALNEQAEVATADVDFAGLWAKIDAEATRIDGQRAWRERADAQRERRTPRGRMSLWGSVAAVAAGVALFVGIPATRQPSVQLASTQTAAGTGVRPVSSKRLPNHVYIDRLAGKDIALRREPKSGTTMIWVNHEVERSGW